MFIRLAELIDSRAKLIAAIAALAFLAAGAYGGGVADRLDPYGADDPATESIIADEQLADAGYRNPSVVMLFEGVDVGSAGTERRVTAAERQLRGRGDVATVSSFYSTGSRDFVSTDGDSTYLAIALTDTEDDGMQDAAEAIAEEFAAPGVSFGGNSILQAQVNEQVEKDLQRAELIVFPLLMLLSLLFFRSLVAAALPLLVGAISIVTTFALLRVASEIGSISVFALNLTTGLGLGLAIDYSLFIVSRYREEIAKSGPGREAMRRTMATAGRTVLFSSLTVAAALASLTVFPQRFLYSMGLGGSMVAVAGALVSLTVLPAVLTLLGERVNSLSPGFLQRRAERDARPEQAGFWYRLSRFVMRRPLPIATASTVMLLALGVPFLGIEFTTPDGQVLPRDHSARQVDDALRADFPPFRDSPADIVVSGGSARDAAAVAARAARVGGVDAVAAPLRLDAGTTLLVAYLENPPISAAGRESVRDLREIEVPGTDVRVSGYTARFLDFQSSLVDHLPIAAGIIVGATLIILFLFTGSAILPVKALIMNVLNLSAVFGILVLIFQDGRLEGLLGYTGQGAIEQSMPILLFAVAFGLSTDYAVFLLSRIKEARDSGVGDREAVAVGLERTGRIVTAAALLFAIAIGAFATSEIIFIKQNGIGTALAVLIDASIIRALLVPSLMEMLGAWNWWAPAPLRRLHARFGLREA